MRIERRDSRELTLLDRAARFFDRRADRVSADSAHPRCPDEDLIVRARNFEEDLHLIAGTRLEIRVRDYRCAVGGNFADFAPDFDGEKAVRKKDADKNEYLTYSY
jgi:hypothetical protein